MDIVKTLRHCFRLVARGAGWQKDVSLSQTEELLAKINSIKSIHAEPLQKNVKADPLSFNITFDWMCLVADRVGPPAGVRTKFQLRWAQGAGVRVAGRDKPEGGMLHSPTNIETPLPLETLLPIMAVIQARQAGTFGITPCPLVFERARIDDVRELVKVYRELVPRPLTLVKKDSENNFKN